MTAAQWPLQEAIYLRLTSDGELTALISGVFDEVPEATPYPYVVLGEITLVPSEAHDRSGSEATGTLHIWSDYRGYAEAAQILSHVDRLLHRARLPIEGFDKVSVAQESHQFMRDPNPEIRHVAVRYRVWLEEA